MALGWCELLRTSIADIGCPIEALTAFSLEVRAVLIAGWARGTLDPAANDLSTCIGLPAMIAMLTEILQVYEEAMIFPHAETVSLDLL